MLSKFVYPLAPVPLSQVESHQCLPYLTIVSQRSNKNKRHHAAASAVLAIMTDIGKRPAEWAKPRPVVGAFDHVPDMPNEYDFGLVVEELVRLRIFVVEPQYGANMLVPAESATAPAPETVEPPKARLSITVSAAIDQQVRDLSHVRRVAISALFEEAMAAYLSQNV